MVKIIAMSRSKERGVSSISATFQYEGELIPLTVNEVDQPAQYNEINLILKNEDLNIVEAAKELFAIMSPEVRVREVIQDSHYLSSKVHIKDGVIYFGDNRLEDELSTHMLSLLDDNNVPKDEKLWRSYVRFLDNLHQNASEEIRKQLFRWIDYENRSGNSFAITDDGCLVGYKGCDGTVLDPVSKFTGFAIVDGEEMNGHIPNRVGSVIQMPRSSVQHDPSVGCSVGLHVGTRDYASQWAPILILVKVNPRDVVSVPYECDSQKMRVCEYTVLEVTDVTEEHRRYYETGEDYSDEDYSDEECLNCYEDSCGESCCVNNCEDCEEEEIEDVMTLSEALSLLEDNSYIEVIRKEDKRFFEGEVVDVYVGKRNGVILKDGDEYSHIKLDNIAEYFVLSSLEKDPTTIDDLLAGDIINLKMKDGKTLSRELVAAVNKQKRIIVLEGFQLVFESDIEEIEVL